MAPRKSRTEGPSRKEKSLSVLSSNFLSLYNRDGVDFVKVDAAASELGDARRRIYDIVYVLESMGVMQKKAKSHYTWKGFGELSERLVAFKDEGMKQGFHTFLPKVSNQREHIWPDKCSEPDKGDSVKKRNEISLGLVTQNFVKLLLCSAVKEISLDKAALALVGDGDDRTSMRNKVRRRLSDSANVLSSMELLQKTGDKSRQPSFRWIGMAGSCRNGSSTAPDMKNSQRAFGTEKHPKDKTENAKVGSSTEQHQKYGPEDFVFGPFTPNAISAGHENRESSQIQDLDRPFRAYQPQFSNQVW